MRKTCERVEAILATDGARALREDAAAREHVAECSACFALLESTAELDACLAAMPPLDASDETVAALLARPELTEPVRAESSGSTRVPRWARSLAVAATLVVAVSIGLLSTRRLSVPEPSQEKELVLAKLEEKSPVPLSASELEQLRSLGYVGGKDDVSKSSADSGDDLARGPLSDREDGRRSDPSKQPRAKVKRTEGNERTSEDFRGGGTPALSEPVNKPAGRPEVGQAQGGFVERDAVSTPTRFSDELVEDLPVPGRLYHNVLTLAPDVEDADGDGDPNVLGSRNRDFKAVVGGVSNVDPLAETDIGSGRGGSAGVSDIGAARRFLAERASLEGLSFQEAAGYWANTYVPGDPALRLLQARLAGADPAVLGDAAPALHGAVRRTAQPFDPPESSALAVYLHADRTGLPERGRVLLQVGLQATPRHGGRRPAMNLAVVLDPRSSESDDVAAGIRALLVALAQAREPGDRFRLFVAGPDGRRAAIEPADFSYGFVAVTLERLLDDPAVARTSPQALVAATKAAIEAVAAADDPDAPLGSSEVLLLTAAPLDATARALAELAHQSALAGIPLGVVGVGPDVTLDAIDRIALAGQGRRRLLQTPAGAGALIERELAAAGRTVARVVRLRIRLAPGVELIDVLGSRRLGEAGAQRVRDSERMVDLRLSRTLGIEADRGEDEDSLQIVIPSFYAGDRHVILLDVVAPGPGPLAEVVARYKDLAYLRNGVSRAGLSLGGEEASAGPLERNVLDNLLALRLSETLERAGRSVADGDRETAAALLEEFRGLLVGLRHELPGLGGDAAHDRDIEMLVRYRDLLRDAAVGAPEQLAYLSDSLRYAGWLRLLPPPASY